MSLEYEIRNDRLIWARNPFTGVISYVVDVSAKSFAFTLQRSAKQGEPEARLEAPDPDAMRFVTSQCPFCPGNENQAPAELMRLGPEAVSGWKRNAADDPAGWVIRVFNNRFPRVPAELTGGRNESYVIVEDPRHFVDRPTSLADLLYTAALGEEHFLALMETDAHVVGLALKNSAVRSIVVRKNQGRESGASQPHVHQQIIGAPAALPAIAAEAKAARENPAVWDEIIGLVSNLGLLIENEGGVVSYASPIGAFPRSFDVVMPGYRGNINQLSRNDLRSFARALYRILGVLDSLPLDYEIHQGEGVPLHAHVNARLFPYSNVGGTLNLPSAMLDNVPALRARMKGG